MKLRIEKAVYGGAGLARIPEGEAGAGKAIFVPLTLPGEVVDAHAVEDRHSYMFGLLDAVIESSAARTLPGCEYFPACGGCQYQHADYSAQLEMKVAILREALTRTHVAAPDAIETASSEPWGYRNRIRLHVAADPDWTLCYRRSGSHSNLPVDHCPIAAPLLQEAIRAVQAVARSLAIPAGLFREIEFFTNAEQDSLLLSLFTQQPATAAPILDQFCRALPPALQTRGAALFAHSPEEGRRSHPRQIATWGEPAITYPIADQSYRVSAGAFFQVNRFLAPQLLALVTEARTGALAWDLYAGVGLFSSALARRFAQVVAVEAAPTSSLDLKHNLPARPHRAVISDTLRFLQSESRRGESRRPDLVVVDPPRAGLGKEVCGLLASTRAPEIVYVSCDPATLARDLALLQPSGYRPTRLTLIDLFPQTFHLETVAVLKRQP
jgi:23S rRNA (uracil1939-C5)-methyltransferase